MVGTTNKAEGLTQAIARFAADIRYEDLPPGVVRTAKRLVLDSLGTTLAGGTLGDGGPEVAAVVQAAGGAPESTVIGFGTKVSAVMAALANGAMVHALNYDAIGSEGGHPGAFALTAPLAVAERKGGVTGKEFIAALVGGVEVEIRAVMALLKAGVDTKGRFLEGQLLSYLGATLSASRVLGLSVNQIDSALGLMLMQASGSRQVVVYGDPPAKGIYAAFPNQGGVLSALLALQGLRAECAALEGEAGLFAMFYNGVYAPEAMTEGLGEEFHTLSTTFKPWPTSGLVHAFIEAGLRLRQQHGLKLASIARVHLTGHPETKNWFEPVEERRRPRSAAAAANSIAFGTAKALVNGDVKLGDFTESGLGQPEVLALTQLTEYSLDASVAPHAGTVEVTTVDGRKRVERVDIPLGQPRRPLTDEQLQAKFRDCAAHAGLPIAAPALERIIAMIGDLESVPDMSLLTEALHPADQEK